MRKKLAVTVAAAALAAVSFPAGPARANHLCAIWAPPFDQVPCAVVGALCSEPWPPFSFCR